MGTFPGPYTGTSWPAAKTVVGVETRGTATERLEIFRKSRRETPGVAFWLLGSFRFGSFSCMGHLRMLSVRSATAPWQRRKDTTLDVEFSHQTTLSFNSGANSTDPYLIKYYRSQPEHLPRIDLRRYCSCSC